MQEKIKNLIREVLKNLDLEIEDISLEHPADLKMGDYSTNVAMVLGKKNKINSKEFAEKIVDEIKNSALTREDLGGFLEKIESKNGFINFYLSQSFFVNSIKEILVKKEDFGKNKIKENKKIMVEYTDPNPFKPVHIGHLMTNAIGESIARVLEYSGASVYRANYQGDIGLHVAKAIYGLLKFGLPDENKSISEKARYIGELYAKGNDVYETDENVKKEIDVINKKIYEKSDKKINEIYDWGFKITMSAFEDLYKILGTEFKFYFLESEMAPIGESIVRKNIPKIFEESGGAIVFKAEKYDPKLHTRVFVTKSGLPTYETKELGLFEEKFKKLKDMDLSITITANEQKDYMRVVSKAISIIYSGYENNIKHITHGMMRLVSGKMSSRKGNVVTGESLLLESFEQILDKIKDRDLPKMEKEKISKEVGVAALKYSILKQNIGADIIYDSEKSISFEGDSGPYLQYSHARANSILEKAKRDQLRIMNYELGINYELTEVEKLLYRFPEVVKRSTEEFAPHYIANYLIELARAFNAFYGNTKIIDNDDETSSYKLAITSAFTIVMKNGLYLLSIKAPERM